MVLVAILFNYPLLHRRYPEALAARSTPATHYPDISHADLVAALSQIDGFVDASEEDLLRIYELATQRPHPALDQSGENRNH